MIIITVLAVIKIQIVDVSIQMLAPTKCFTCEIMSRQIGICLLNCEFCSPRRISGI